jgi:hypothetical protein
MKPRAKKGPTWANDMKQEEAAFATRAEPNLDTADDLATEAHVGDASREVGLSDQEWMKQHMSKSVDVVERAFEQSDEEDAPVEVCCFDFHAPPEFNICVDRILFHQSLTAKLRRRIRLRRLSCRRPGFLSAI